MCCNHNLYPDTINGCFVVMPTYKSRFKSWLTNQGDIWDIIAIECYGDEHCCHAIQEYNTAYIYQDFFPANIRIMLPEEITIEENLKTGIKIPKVQEALPWR